MEIGNLIGKGNTADVYEYGTNVLKLFKEDFPQTIIKNEYEYSSIISKFTSFTPKVIEMIKIGNQTGIVYERIVGVSMLEMAIKGKDCAKLGEELAVIHNTVLSTKIEGLPKYKECLENNINYASNIDQNIKNKVIDILHNLPDGDKLCHGDFHPGNVMICEGKPIVLDWMTAGMGNPAADVARTTLILTMSVIPEHYPFGKKVQSVLNQTYESYINTINIDIDRIEEWKVPIAAARLVESISEEEKNNLLEFVYSEI